MATRQALIRHLWTEVINAVMRAPALDNIVANGTRNPEGPFGDTGRALERILAAGVSHHDLRLVIRSGSLRGSVRHTLCAG